ncbi:MAG TPA: HAMP domain-containing sensor histidine kinase [Kofleriaceae bacterium]|jgi:signal transduction histidine kinase|nr:HAMP domain-containing sensor histidine kinase [Kofleriaceae bacterium]
MGDEVGGRALSDDDRTALRAFGRWLAFRPDVEAVVRSLADQQLKRVGIPWPNVDTIDPQKNARAAAIDDGDWGPLDQTLDALGNALAEAGASAAAWFPVVVHYQMAAARAPDADPEVLVGAVRYADHVVRRIDTAYSRRHRELLRVARDEIELYAELVRQSPSPKVVLEWRDPPDRTSFYLIAANPASRNVAEGMLDSLGQPLSDQYPHWPTMELCDRVVETIETGKRNTCLLRTMMGGTFDVTIFQVRERTVGLVYYDIAERQRILEEVQEANRSLDAFAYVASHDLKAPLRDITNLSTWIDEDAGDAMPAGSRKHLAQLRDRAARMDKLLDDLLAYSRAGRIRVASEDTTMRAIIDEAVGLAGTREGFAVRVPAAEVALRAPKTPLVHVVRNLVDNALKHHDRDHGVVAIEVEETREAIRVTVADDGPGIPAEFRERVFQPFTTLRPRDRVEGSGMGLAIVKKLIESHGGRIEIEGGDGRGTRMTFWWPKQPRGSR